MPKNTWQELVSVAFVDGVALTNTVTPTSLIGGTGTGASHAKLTFAPGYFDARGKSLRIGAAGRISTLVTTPGTLTLDLRLGSVVIANGGAMTLSTTAKTNVTWRLSWDLTLRTEGSGTTATFMHDGEWKSEAAGATTVAGEAKTIMLPQTAPAVGSGFDMTAQQTLDLFGTWSVANAANSILLHKFWVEATN